MKINRLFYFLFLFLWSVKIFAIEDCKMDFNQQKTADCVKCQTSLPTPADKTEGFVKPLLSFVTESDKYATLLNKLKTEDAFLNKKENISKCSNYKTIGLAFKKEFQEHLSQCEKGADFFNKTKALCEWTLNTYSSKLTDAFYAYWSSVDSKGKVKLKPGKKIEDLEMPIRAHATWCKKVKSTYKNKLFLYCDSVDEWVSQFDIVKKVSESMKRDMQASEEKVPTAKDREKVLKDACKYFDTNPITTFSQNLYMSCL